MEELTMEDLEGRRIGERFGRRAARSYKSSFFSISKKKKKDILTRNGPLSVSLRCRSTALCVARLSGVCPSAGFTFDLLGSVGACGSGRLSGLLLILCGLRLLLSGLFIQVPLASPTLTFRTSPIPL